MTDDAALIAELRELLDLYEEPAIQRAAARIAALTAEKGELARKLDGALPFIELHVDEEIARAKAEAERDALREALAWYGERAADLARYLGIKPPQITAVEAVTTELVLDAGKRAALAGAKP